MIPGTLTDRQIEILEFVRGFISENGYSPSIREISNNFNITPKGAQEHIIAIEKKGYIKRIPKIARGIIVL